MSATNHTANLDLPQFLPTDKPSWLGDVNGAMKSISDGYGTQANNIATANAAASQAQSQANANQIAITQLNTEVGSINDRVTSLEAGSGTEGINTRLTNIESDVTALEGRVDTLDTTATSLGANIGTLTTTCETLEDDLDALSAQVTQNKTDADATQTSLNTLSAQVTLVESTANGAVSTANTASDVANGASTTASQAKTTANEAKTAAATNATSISGLTTRVTALESGENTSVKVVKITVSAVSTNGTISVTNPPNTGILIAGVVLIIPKLIITTTLQNTVANMTNNYIKITLPTNVYPDCGSINSSPRTNISKAFATNGDSSISGQNGMIWNLSDGIAVSVSGSSTSNRCITNLVLPVIS